MLRSKATAALMRLKEMDQKYNIKRNEGKRFQSNVSTESSLEDTEKILQVKPRIFSGKNSPEDDPVQDALSSIAAPKEIGPQVSPKSRVEVRIPMERALAAENLISDSASLKRAGKTSLKRASITEADKSISAERKIDDAEASLESLSSLEDNVPKANPKIATHETVASFGNNIESPVSALLSRRSEISEIISEAAKSVNEYSSRKGDENSSTQGATVAEDSIPVLNSDRDDTKIEEAIGTTEDKSEIISDLSVAMDKNISSRKEQKTQYEDDTFEEASTSSESSSFAVEKLKETSEGDTIISGVKQIKITPHKQTEDAQKIVVDEEGDKEIVELVAPKMVQSTSECDIGLDEELSNYVKTTENVDEMVPISLLKLCKQTASRKHARRSKRHRKSSNENMEASSVASDHEKLTERKENNMDNDLSRRNGSATSRDSEKKDSPSLSEQSNEESIHTTEQEVLKNELQNAEPEDLSSEDKFLTETPKKSDVTSTLRNLNKDAINAIVRRHRVQSSKEVSSKSKHGKNIETVVKLPPADVSKNGEDENCDGSSFENLATSKNCGRDQRSKEKKAKSKKYPRSSKSRKASNCSKVEGKHSRFECKQTHRLRKYAAALRLQQERQDIRNYLLELERTRLEFGPGASVASSQLPAFKPLEFPKIGAFVKLGADLDESISKNKGESTGLQERVLMIKQWLKDQYILYRDYSNLARTVNKKYIPASLEDAKRTIRELQNATIKSR